MEDTSESIGTEVDTAGDTGGRNGVVRQRAAFLILAAWAMLIVGTAMSDLEFAALVAVLVFLGTAPVVILVLAAIIPSKPRDTEPRL